MSSWGAARTAGCTLLSRLTPSFGRCRRAAARRWRRAGPAGVASAGRRHQLADQPHRREATAMPVRPSQRLVQSPVLVTKDPALERGARRMDMDIDLDRAVRWREKQVSDWWDGNGVWSRTGCEPARTSHNVTAVCTSVRRLDSYFCRCPADNSCCCCVRVLLLLDVR